MRTRTTAPDLHLRVARAAEGARSDFIDPSWELGGQVSSSATTAVGGMWLAKPPDFHDVAMRRGERQCRCPAARSPHSAPSHGQWKAMMIIALGRRTDRPLTVAVVARSRQTFTMR